MVVLVACGGKIAGERSGAPDDGGATTDDPSTADDSGVTTTPTDPSNPGGPTGDPFPVCPAHSPTAGASCSTRNLGCAYVDYDKGTCISFTCDGNGIWEVSTPAGC